MISNLRLLFRLFKVKVWAIPGRMIALFFLASLVVVPLITKESYVIRILSLAGIYAIFAVSWDVLAGYTGQLNLGQALFFGVGAYGAALLNLNFSLPPFITIPLGGIGSVAVGLMASLPALRLRGFYLGLVTLSFPIILTGIIFLFSDVTGGELGLFGLSPLSDSRILDYYIVLLVMMVSIFAMYKFTDAKSTNIRTGIILHAIREDEITARNSGIDTTKYKLLAFAVSGFFAGIAGGLYAHFLRISGPSTLELFFSFQAILWTIFGGIRTIYGAVAGVYFLFILMELLRINPLGDQIRFVVFALILIFTLLYMPEGIATWIRDKIEIECQRCKINNVFTRNNCRACGAPLRLTGRQSNHEEGVR
jgi:branched-chain amino acid transport system permease protein